MKNPLQILAVSAILLSACSVPSQLATMRLKNMNPAAYYSEQGEIALLKATDRNDIQKMDESISQGAKVNAVGNEEMTPLAWAFAKQNLAGYQHLLEKGADPNFKTKKTAWNNDGHSVMQFAAMSENPEYLILALKHGGNPNAPDSLRGRTILYTSIDNRRGENIKILVKSGANLNHRDKAGFTPLMESVIQDKYDLAFLLLSLGADPSIKTPRGNHVGNFISMFADKSPILSRDRKQREWCTKVVAELKQRRLM
jgi:ankyrin repeat protein